MKKKDIIGIWFDPLKTKPTEIEDYKMGDYVVIKITTKNNDWDYKLGWYHKVDSKWQFYIINEPPIRYNLVGWTILPKFNLKK